MAEPFRFPIRVYYEDTDTGGVVYHAQYVCFLERARTEWLRALGIVQSRLAAERNLLFAVAGMELKFRLPARLDDALTATCELVKRGGASLEFRQQLVRDADNALLVEARVRAACLRASDFRPQAIPDDLVLT
jgi:tol-pal system-associated acyl-CoA thioesterase